MISPTRSERMSRTATLCGMTGGLRRVAVLALVSATLAGCSTFGGSGPSSIEIGKSEGRAVQGSMVKIVDLDAATGARLEAANVRPPFSQVFGDVPATDMIVGPGDQLSIQIWEAPPAVLFGSSSLLGSSGAFATPGAVSNSQTISGIIVDANGSIPVPFVGRVTVAGRTPAQIGSDIRRRLVGKAHDPQVVVTLAQSSSSTVSVVGDVKTNGRVTLSPYGERILEILAGAGGVDDRVDKAMIQINRGGRVAALPLTRIINEPSENIRLQPNDVVTAMTETLSFTVLGASGKNDEIEFEATGVSLAQALGRMGGLKDDRANVRGVFVFRLERPEAVGVTPGDGTRLTSEGLVPVIYRVDMSRPETLFLAQKFTVHDKDVVYVSSAPLTDFQRFMQLLSSMVFPVIGLTQTL